MEIVNQSLPSKSYKGPLEKMPKRPPDSCPKVCQYLSLIKKQPIKNIKMENLLQLNRA